MWGQENRFGSTAAVGALPPLRAATDPGVEGGQLLGLRFIVRRGPVRHPYASPLLGLSDRRTLWDVSEDEVGLRLDVEAMVRDAHRS